MRVCVEPFGWIVHSFSNRKSLSHLFQYTHYGCKFGNSTTTLMHYIAAIAAISSKPASKTNMYDRIVSMQSIVGVYFFSWYVYCCTFFTFLFAYFRQSCLMTFVYIQRSLLYILAFFFLSLLFASFIEI